jgi:hypothetical protein
LKRIELGAVVVERARSCCGGEGWELLQRIGLGAVIEVRTGNFHRGPGLGAVVEDWTGSF